MVFTHYANVSLRMLHQHGISISVSPHIFIIMMNTYQMYLGLTRPDNEIITTEQFNAYTHEVLDALFEGYTISDAVGSWKNQREQTKIVSICTEYKHLVTKAANLYKEFFEQDAVAISTLPALEMV